MARIAVCIPSYRRPQGLARLLDALAALDTRHDVRVFVADNDAARHQACDLCRRKTVDNYRWPIDVFVVPERGIAQARNALMARALASDAAFVAMLDDDEWPDPEWLDAFVAAQRQWQADALHGTVERVFAQEPAAWAVACAGIQPFKQMSGPITMIESSSNIFLRRAALEALARPHFDPAFALTGGEDRDFFTRLRLQGARFAWCAEAKIHAHVPASRLTLGWILRRAYRVGNSDMRVFLKYRPSLAARLREYGKIAGACLVFPLALVIFGGIAQRRAQTLCKIFRATGKTAALFGWHYDEYAETHGE